MEYSIVPELLEGGRGALSLARSQTEEVATSVTVIQNMWAMIVDVHALYAFLIYFVYSIWLNTC